MTVLLHTIHSINGAELNMVRAAPATRCASSVSSSHAAGYAASGCATTWRTSRAGSRALGAKVAEGGLIPTEAQVQALERKELDDEACGEIEKARPGYLGSRDTFYVGILKGVGRIYQQPMSIPMPRWRSASCIRPKRPLLPPNC